MFRWYRSDGEHLPSTSRAELPGYIMQCLHFKLTHLIPAVTIDASLYIISIINYQQLLARTISDVGRGHGNQTQQFTLYFVQIQITLKTIWGSSFRHAINCLV